MNRDLIIYWSTTNHKPEADNCDGCVENTTCLTIDTGTDDRFFSKEAIYFKFETLKGCQASIKVVFPKQNMAEIKRKKDQENGINPSMAK